MKNIIYLLHLLSFCGFSQVNPEEKKEIFNTIDCFFTAKNENKIEEIIKTTHPIYFESLSINQSTLRSLLSTSNKDKSIITKQIPTEKKIIGSKYYEGSKYCIVNYLMEQTSVLSSKYKAKYIYKSLRHKYGKAVLYDSLNNIVKFTTRKELYIIRDDTSSSWKILNRINYAKSTFLDPKKYFPEQIQKWIDSTEVKIN